MRRSADRRAGTGEGRTPAAIVLEELARRRLSRQQLAQQARISLSTLGKALSGRRPFTLATMVRLEQALGVSLRGEMEPASTPDAASPPQLAPDEVGSYTRAAVTWIEGDYLTIRPSFGDKAAVYAYRTEIFWDAGRSSLAFRESERIDAAFSQQGIVSVPSFSGHIYFVTNEHGQYRLIVVGRPSIDRQMHGILTTLQVGRGAHLIPVSTPIALIPMKGLAQADFGRIHAGHDAYSRYRALLKRTLDEPFAVLLAP